MCYASSLKYSVLHMSVQAWKGMLDSEGFVRAGWVHDLRLHQFSTSDGVKFVIKGKVLF